MMYLHRWRVFNQTSVETCSIIGYVWADVESFDAKRNETPILRVIPTIVNIFQRLAFDFKYLTMQK